MNRNQCAGGLVRRWLGRGARQTEIAAPIIIMIAASALLMIWTHAPNNGNSLLRAAAQRWTIEQPGDNAIPLDFAKGDASGHIPTPLLADWLSSDRPLLQTALYLVSPGYLIRGPDEQTYQPAAIAFQIFVLLGAWILARALGASMLVSVGAMVAVFFTPIVIASGAYVWPKLLSASFLCAVAALHFSPVYYERRNSFFMLD